MKLKKVNLPWQFKIIFKIILSRIPFNNIFQEKLGIFKHGEMDNVNYLLRVFDGHLYRAGLNYKKLRNKRILEIGPGNSIGNALVSASCLAESYLIDNGNFACKSIAFYKDLNEELIKRELRPPDIKEIKDISTLLDKCNSKYLVNGINSFKEIPDNSIDFIFSQAVLEHINLVDFKELLYQTKRVLNKNGICSHRVDLRDHLGGKLNNLRFSEKLWESNFFKKSGFYTNRLRCCEIINLCYQVGFNVKEIKKRRWLEPVVNSSKLNYKFQKFSQNELLISGFDILLEHNSSNSK